MNSYYLSINYLKCLHFNKENVILTFTSSRKPAVWDRAGGCGKEGKDGDPLQGAVGMSFRLPLALRIFATPN